jgi:hypothetical protein
MKKKGSPEGGEGDGLPFYFNGGKPPNLCFLFSACCYLRLLLPALVVTCACCYLRLLLSASSDRCSRLATGSIHQERDIWVNCHSGLEFDSRIMHDIDSIVKQYVCIIGHC